MNTKSEQLKEPTVEEALKELREMAPTYSHLIEFYDYKRKVLIKITIGGLQCGSAWLLGEAMQKAKEFWKEQPK